MEMSHHMRASKATLTYGAPTLIIPGVIGNIICLIVLQQKFFKKTSFGFLLSALALADTGVLLTGLLRLWIREIADIDVRTLSSVGCKMHVFFTYFFPQLSSWMIVLVTLERTLALKHRCRRYVTFKAVVITWTFTALAIVCTCIYPTIEYSLKTLTAPGLPSAYTASLCIPHHSHSSFRDTFAWVDFVLVVFVPFVIIVTCNGIIIHHKIKTSHRLSSKVLMLLALCFVFIITTIPRSVYFLGLPWEDVATDAKNLLYVACILVYNLSNALNFVLYCVASRKFRTTAKTLCCCASRHDELVEESSNDDLYIVT